MPQDEANKPDRNKPDESPDQSRDEGESAGNASGEKNEADNAAESPWIPGSERTFGKSEGSDLGDTYELNPSAHGGDDIEQVQDDEPSKLKQSSAMASKSYAELPRQENKLSAWLLLLLVLLAAVPASLSQIHRLDVNSEDEARTILTSVETTRRQRVLAVSSFLRSEQLVPHLHAQARYDEPPGIHWVQMLAFSPLDVEKASADQFILSARVASIVLALMSVAFVFWIGHSIGRTPTACFAALIFVSNPLFVYHAKIATEDIGHLAFSLLAIAAGLWAIRPLRPLPSTERQFIGWITCGLAFGAATLTAGPVTLVTVLCPIFITILLCPDRISHLLGLLAALLIGVLLQMPWILYAHEQDPVAWRSWIELIFPTAPLTLDTIRENTRLHLEIALLGFLPWTLWLLAGLVQPFSKSSGGRRINLFLGWTWLLVMCLLILPMPTIDPFAAALPLIVAASLFVGQCFYHFTEMSSAGRYPRTWRIMRWVHLLIVTLATGAIPTMIFMQPLLVEKGLIAQEMMADLGKVFVIGLAIVLLLMVLLSLHGVLKHFPERAVIFWSLWSIVLMTVLAIPISQSERFESPLQEEATDLRQMLIGADAYWLQRDIAPIEPNPIVALYAGRTMQRIVQSQVPRAIELYQAENSRQQLLLVTTEELPSPGDEFVRLARLRNAKLVVWTFAPGDRQEATIPAAITTENNATDPSNP